MSITQRSQQDHDITALLTTFGEDVVYTPKGGEARTIRAHVREDTNTADSDGARQDAQQIIVLTRRDATEGIDEPIAGDTVTITRGTQTVDYKYAGSSENSNQYRWRLRFLRVSTPRLGSNVRTR